MPRVSYSNRQRIVSIFYKHSLQFVPGRFHVLKHLADNEDIITSVKTIRRIVNHWLVSGTIEDKKSFNRHNKITKITNGEITALDRLIYRKRECTAEQAKRKLLLRASGRTIQRYLNRLGWRKIRTKYCHFVTVKNRIERVVYCNFCLINGERFFFSIHIDECTVAMNKNADCPFNFCFFVLNLYFLFIC